MTGRSPAFHHPLAFARFERSQLARAHRAFGGILRHSAAVIAEGIRLLRSAPPLGDVGTRGNELTAWADSWNRGGNPRDSNRE